MTTSSPTLAMKIESHCKEKGCNSLDAPVSGGDVGARNATLSIMIGGEKSIIDNVMPIFNVMGKNIRHMGKTGYGQHTKVVNQIIIASTMIGMVEGLIYAHKAGLNLDEALLAVCKGAAGSWSLSNYGPRILNGDFEPGFFIKHFVKDMEIALNECKKMNIKLPGLQLAHELYNNLKKNSGYENKGTQSLIFALEKMNKLSIPLKYKVDPKNFV